MELKNFIFFKEKVFDQKNCQSVLNCLDSKFEKHSWHNNTDNTTSSSTDEFLIQRMNVKANEYLFETIQFCLNEYCSRFKVIEKTSNIISKITQPRINFYEKGHRMKTHYDHIRSIFDGNERGIPILTLVGVLNSEFEGGEFVVADEIYDMKQGDFIVFPSCFLYPHSVNLIKKGKRISFVSWAY